MNLRKISILLAVLLLTLVIGILLWLMAGYYNAREPMTSLPLFDIQDTIWSTDKVDDDLLTVKNAWYTLETFPSGRITVKTPGNEVILSNLVYFSSYVGYKDNWGINNTSVTRENDTTISVYGTALPGTIIQMKITTHTNLPKLDIKVTTKYSTETVVNQEALVARFDVPVSEVYKKNRKIDTQAFKTEYWLQKQGVKFGEGDKSALIYHTTAVSSLQLNTSQRLLFVNLEYFKDHPFINIPFQPDGTNRWNDISASRYNTGDERLDSVTFYFGKTPECLPRIMLVPRGFLAGHVFTEHADGGEALKHHLAAYFGADSIEDITKATGGFVGHNIPVTKSIMFSDSLGKLSDLTFSGTSHWPEFKAFLEQLRENGRYDICLHTPEDLNSDRRTLEEAIGYMKEYYDTRSWIDHGMYSGKINRECFVCDGLIPDSEFYTADLWGKYDTRYFWSPAVEMIRNQQRPSTKGQLKKFRLLDASESLWQNHMPQDRLVSVRPVTALKELIRNLQSNEEELNSLLPGRGEYYPTPLYWQHPTYTDGFYSWATDYVKDYRKLTSGNSVEQLRIEMNHIDSLISNQGIFIGHGYYVRGRDVIFDQDGILVIHPSFDRLLAYLEEKNLKGDLYNTTVKDLLDYWRLTENISFTYYPDNTIELYNENNQSISGLSIVVKADSVYIDDIVPLTRRNNDDLIFWFDMPAKASLKIRFGKLKQTN